MQEDPNDKPAPLRRRILIVPPVLLGLAVFAIAVATNKPPVQSPPAELARSVRVIEVAKADVVPRVTGFGTVQPANVWSAVAQVSGKVVYVHPDFKKGAILDEGTEIVRIDAADYELAIAEAEANIRSAQAKLAEQNISETNFRDLLTIERKSLKLKEAQLLRKRKLLKRGTTAQASVDNEERTALSQRKIVQDIENSLRLLPTQRTVQEEQIAVYKSKLRTAKLNLSRTRIVMPFKGRVAEASVEVTQYVQVGAKLGVADDIKTSEVEAQFPISRLSMFVRATGRADGWPGNSQDFAKLTRTKGIYSIIRLRSGDRAVEWEGRIVRSSDTLDPQTRTVGIISAVDDSYERAVLGVRPPLTKGMFVEVELRAKLLPGKFIAPRSAIHDGKLFVANKQNRLEVRDVKLGLILGNVVVVEAGIKAGDKVVVSDVSPAIPGMLLKTTTDKQLQSALVAEAAGTGAVQ